MIPGTLQIYGKYAISETQQNTDFRALKHSAQGYNAPRKAVLEWG